VEVDQAGELVDLDRAQALDQVAAALGRAEQAAGLEVALEREVEHRVELLRRQVVHRELAVVAGGRLLERGERPRGGLDQADRAAQVRLHRRAHLLAHRVVVVADERVQHQRRVAFARVAGVAPGGAVERDLLPHLLDRLAEQVREDREPVGAGHAERLGVAGGGHPHRQLGLHRPRQDRQLDVVAQRAGERHRLAAPQLPHGLDLAEHQVLAVGEVLRREHEVVRLPARRERDADATVREVVDDRPLLGDPDRAVQRRDDAAGADPQPLGDRGDGRAHHRRVRVQPAEVVEVALRRPDRREAVGVGELGALHQQPVLLRAGALAGGEVEQAEVDVAGRRRRVAPDPAHLGLAAGEQHDLEASRERPEQLEHRDVERDARLGEPHAGLVELDPLVHAGEEVGDVAVRDHHALRLAGRARRVDHVREVVRAGTAGEGAVLELRQRVEQHDLRAVLGQVAGDLAGREQHRHLGVLDHERDPLGGIRGIHRDVGAAGLQDRHQADDHVRRARHVHADARAGADAERLQVAGEPRRPRVEVRVGERLVAGHERHGVRGALRLRLEQPVDGRPARVVERGLVPLAEQLREVGVVDQRDFVQRPPVEAGEERAELALHRGDAVLVERLGVVQPRATCAVGRHDHREAGAGDRLGLGGDVDGHRQVGRGAATGGEVEHVRAALARGGQLLADPAEVVRERPVVVGGHAQRHHRRGDALLAAVAQPDVEHLPARQPRRVQQQGRDGRVGVGLVELDRARARRAARGGTGVRQHQRVGRSEPRRPELLVPRRRLVEGRQRGSLIVGEDRQAHALLGGVIETDDHVLGRGRHPHRIAVDGDHRAGLGARALLRHRERGDEHHAVLEQHLGHAERVRVLAVLQPADQPRELLRGPVPAQSARGVGPLVPAEVRAARQILRLAGHDAVPQRPREPAERPDGGLVALGVERQRGVVGSDLHRLALEHLALVDAGRHHVPAHAVVALASQQRPDWRVEARIVRQRAVVEVDRRDARGGHHLGGQHAQVVDAEQMVEGRSGEQLAEVRVRVEAGHVALARPPGDIRVGGHHAAHGVAALEKDLPTGRRERRLPDEEAAEGGHTGRCTGGRDGFD
jgi:hypothetical protein